MLTSALLLSTTMPTPCWTGRPASRYLPPYPGQASATQAIVHNVVSPPNTSALQPPGSGSIQVTTDAVAGQTVVSGRYRLETIVPGQYPGRTRHIHVIIAAARRPALTTQLYFPGETANRRDGIFAPELVMKVREEQAVKLATFDFILDLRA